MDTQTNAQVGIEKDTLLLDIATRNVICLRPENSLGDAARIMAEKRISCIVVSDESGHPLGIVTERNLLQAMQCNRPQDISLGAIMSAPVLSVSESTSCLDAYQMCLREGIRHLAIVSEDQRLSGVVSETDFRLHIHLSALAGQRMVASVMSRKVYTIGPESALQDALDMMQSLRDTCVLVVEDDKPVGIITERDVVRLYAARQAAQKLHVWEVMSAPVLTITVDSTLNRAAERMLSAKVRHLAVVNSGGQLAGLLSEHDLTQTMVQRLVDDKQLAESALLRTLLDTIPDVVWLKDANGVYLTCNQRFERFFGAKKKQIIGKTDYDFVDRELANSFRANDRRALAGNRACVNEEWITYADDGHRELLETLKTPMFDQHGRLIGVLGVARDITDRKQNEEKLREQNEFLAAIFENAIDAFMRINDQGLISAWSGQAEKMFGWSREQAVGRPMDELVIPVRYRQAHKQGLAAFMATGRRAVADARIEINALHRNGQEFPVELSIFQTETAHGREFCAFVRDITELRRSQQALAEQDRLFRAIFNQAPIAIELIDPDSLRFVEANPAASRMLGYSHEEYLQLRLNDIQADLFGEELSAAVRRIQTSSGATFQNRHRCRNGEVLDVEINAQMLDLPGKRLLVGIWSDISQRQCAERALRESESKYRLLFETARDGIFLQGTHGFIDCNETGAAMYGLTRAQVIGRSPVELAPERQPDGRLSTEVAGELIVACLQGEQQQFEWQALRADGGLIDVEICLNQFELGGETCLLAVVRDISERKRAEQALRDSLREYSDLVRSIPVGVYKLRMRPDRSVRFDYVSPRWCEMTGVGEQEALDDIKSALNIVHPQEIDDFLRLQNFATNSLQCFAWEGRVRKKNGEIRWLHIESQPRRLENGDVIWDGIQYDITDRKVAEDALRVTASVFDSVQEAILITDERNNIVDVNSAFTRITGYQREDVLGRNPSLLGSGTQDKAFYAAMWQSLQEKKCWRGEVWNRRKSGEIFAELLSISVICDAKGKVLQYVGVFSDISYLKEHEAELSHAAHYDALTGIPNRMLLADRMKQVIAQAGREKHLVAVCYLDLDGFKPINDSMGHDCGDQVLIDVARRIEHTIRAGDTVARLGGDEFVVLLELEKEEDCIATLERLLAAIARPISVKNKVHTVSASIGVSIYPIDESDSDTLLRHADQAMFVAKQTGKNRYYIYDPALDLRTRDHIEFLNSIRYALENRQLQLYYQPKIDLSSKQLVGVEALIRWRHPERGLLPPAEFLRAIETSELDIDIGNWVITETVAQIQRWRQAGFDLEVSINISAYHLESEGFTENLRRQFQVGADQAPLKLQIEILETAALNDLSMVREILHECRQFGVKFALDDFGTGYSSLSYLSRLPVDVLKIDQSFVRDMLEDHGDKAIVQGVIALAKAFDRQIVAEGIETEEHHRVLLEMGCNIGQGYGIAKPMPADEILLWLIE